MQAAAHGHSPLAFLRTTIILVVTSSRLTRPRDRGLLNCRPPVPSHALPGDRELDRDSASSCPPPSPIERSASPATGPSLVTPLAQALRFASAGIELGGMTLVVTAIGYAIDRHFQHTTLVATAFGTMIGFSAGLYRFIRQALTASQTSHTHPTPLDRNPHSAATDDRSRDPASDRRSSDAGD